MADLRKKARASYSLENIKLLLQNPRTRFITKRARKEAFECGYVTDEEMIEEVETLKWSDFVESTPSDLVPRAWQDVYKVDRNHPLQPDRTQKLYIKLQESPVGTGVVISFHLA